MKQFTLTICAAAMLLFSCNSGGEKKEEATTTDTTKMTTAPTTETTPAVTEPMPDSATMMKNWQSYATPGEVQKMVASWDGTWESDMTMYEPGKPPTKAMGKAVNKMILGGRYQESVHTSNMMGMPFEGRSLLAYDNAKKVFQSNWIDNMGSGMMSMTGSWDAATKSMTLTGKGIDPMTLKDKDFREIFKVVDDNTQMMEMYCAGPDGKEMKMMEIKLTRKK